MGVGEEGSCEGIVEVVFEGEGRGGGGGRRGHFGREWTWRLNYNGS